MNKIGLSFCSRRLHLIQRKPFQVVGRVLIGQAFKRFYASSPSNTPSSPEPSTIPSILSKSTTTVPIRITSSSPSSLSKLLQPIQPDVSYISCTVFDKSGDVVAVSKKFPKTTFLNENKLFPRDLRKIDSSNVDVAPIIGIRPNSILINLLHVKALIKSDSVLVFDTSSPDTAAKLSLFMYDLESKLKTKIVHAFESL
ncbi:unnamed protein product [Ambrosiozyma monospora]|uniref:RNA-splicing protein MRS2 n=1 Tax=Ambrosiozyma monospora TaxID=43982 RepID=A0A9W6T0N0_AMBMO|nr:unnamed protein product [Ambrosiozyma monospora]